MKDVSFEVQRAEVVGIPSTGSGQALAATGQGRTETGRQGDGETRSKAGFLFVTLSPPHLVSERVGTGFHPPLYPPATRGKAGRENIYLNGAIPSTMLRASLRMKKAEIEHKFNEIVAFAEIEKFMDTSVKHYSSGMYVRLAFAVAAHPSTGSGRRLEPEILPVDEVLAVGDAAFQRKCLGKMGDVAREGRTVLHSQAGEDGGSISRSISSIKPGKLGCSKLMPGAGTRLCLMSGRTCL